MASNGLISSLMGAALTMPKSLQISCMHDACEHVMLAHKSVLSSDIIVAMFQCHGCSRVLHVLFQRVGPRLTKSWHYFPDITMV